MSPKLQYSLLKSVTRSFLQSLPFYCVKLWTKTKSDDETNYFPFQAVITHLFMINISVSLPNQSAESLKYIVDIWDLSEAFQLTDFLNCWWKASNPISQKNWVCWYNGIARCDNSRRQWILGLPMIFDNFISALFQNWFTLWTNFVHNPLMLRSKSTDF